MKNTMVAQRYAKALLEASPNEKGLDTIVEQTNEVLAFLETDSEAVRILATPLSSKEQKIEAVHGALGGKVSGTVSDFLTLVIDKGREADLKDILQTLVSLYEQQRGIRRVKVTSAVPLSEAQKKQIMEKITSSGAEKAPPVRSVILEETVDPALIGGIIIQSGDRLYDGSVATRLENIKKTINLSTKQ